MIPGDIIFNELQIHNGGQVKRFHTWPTIGSQTVAEHSWGVARVLCWIYEDVSLNLLKYALVHDVTEFVTGDVPFMVKRLKPAIKQAFKELEEHEEATLGITNNLTQEENRRLKVADYVECMIYCIHQARLGSKIMHRVMVNLDNALCHLCSEAEMEYVVALYKEYNELFVGKVDDHG